MVDMAPPSYQSLYSQLPAAASWQRYDLDPKWTQWRSDYPGKGESSGHPNLPFGVGTEWGSGGDLWRTNTWNPYQQRESIASLMAPPGYYSPQEAQALQSGDYFRSLAQAIRPQTMLPAQDDYWSAHQQERAGQAPAREFLDILNWAADWADKTAGRKRTAGEQEEYLAELQGRLGWQPRENRIPQISIFADPATANDVLLNMRNRQKRDQFLQQQNQDAWGVWSKLLPRILAPELTGTVIPSGAQTAVSAPDRMLFRQPPIYGQDVAQSRWMKNNGQTNL